MPSLARVFGPRDRAYFDLFEEAGRNVREAAERLDRMLRGYPDTKDMARDILTCEHEGDRITHDIIDRLNHTFVAPIDREDILALASAIADIVDYTERGADTPWGCTGWRPRGIIRSGSRGCSGTPPARSPRRTRTCAASATSRAT